MKGEAPGSEKAGAERIGKFPGHDSEEVAMRDFRSEGFLAEGCILGEGEQACLRAASKAATP